MAANYIRRKYRMRKYARAHDIEIPKGFRPWVYGWGGAATELLKRIQRHAKLGVSGRWNGDVQALLFPKSIPTLRIIPKSYRWARTLVNRAGKPSGVVWHHAAASSCTADQIHSWHLSNGWSGFAYSFFVDKEGRVFRGRPEGKLGGHTLGASTWLGVCCEGNFDRENMPDAQLKACQALHCYLHRKYDGLPDRRHRDMPGNSTSCPGKHYPFEKIVKVK